MAGDYTKGIIWLYENDHADKGPRSPSHTGNGRINRATLGKIVEAMKESRDGEVELDVACWMKKTRNGDDFQSIVFDLKDPKYSKPKRSSGGSGDEDDVPF